jgi:N-acetylmuramoyl-L-alanine amidase
VEHAIAQFVEHKVSAHFLIDEKGEIFQLIDEKDIAYHAGVSFWRGCSGLNKSSIGIEFINKAPFEKKFEEAQMAAGVVLCKYLAAKYQIDARNIVGHSDIAYFSENGLLNRKQDPSHLFDWEFLAKNYVGIFPQFSLEGQADEQLFAPKDKSVYLKKIKQDLQKFGYRVLNLNDEFDEEMQGLAIVFNRRFLRRDSNSWFLSSQLALQKLMGFC